MGEIARELHRSRLHVARLGMLKGKVQKHALDRRKMQILLGLDAALRRLERERIVLERARRVAKRIARKLIQKKNEHQRPLRRRGHI